MFLEDLRDEELAGLYQGAQALLMPQEEDFGYTALEAQLFGCPVIAYNAGGARETVLDGKTGLLFDEQSATDLLNAVERFHTLSYNVKKSFDQVAQKHLKQFDRSIFEKRITNVVTDV